MASRFVARASTMKYYAIRKGRSGPMIVKTWEECSAQVTGFPGAEFKSHSTESEALHYLAPTINPLTISGSSRSPPVETNLANQNRPEPIRVIPRPGFQYLFYTDGSYSNGKGGFAVVNASTRQVLYGPVNDAHITSQRAELTAILLARSWAEDDSKTCEIRTDSGYATETFNRYIYSWKNQYGNNPERWRTTEGKPVSNLDLILDILQSPLRFSIFHVRGHNGDYFNTIADEFAKKGRQSRERILEDL